MKRTCTVKANTLVELNEATAMLMRFGWAIEGTVRFVEGKWEVTLYLQG